MKISNYIEQIKTEFASGKTFVELQSDNPISFRFYLYKAARRRGLLWSFAVSEKSVFVIL
jgi:hypothetical protein